MLANSPLNQCTSVRFDRGLFAGRYHPKTLIIQNIIVMLILNRDCPHSNVIMI